MKHMIVYSFRNLSFNINNYLNLIKIIVSAIVHTRHSNQLSHLELIGLVFDKHELKNIRKGSTSKMKRGTPSNIDI
ncbi:hypothetical protein K502DRAFT_324128 [Neoconidiobolus thromboides FSU 785]|nr:hypothetical protein K502DRAFT_324128 [Neoconidiobolus thromboides FSU 785]